MIQTTLAGNPLEIPIYVDRVTSGAEAQPRLREDAQIRLASPHGSPATGAAGALY